MRMSAFSRLITLFILITVTKSSNEEYRLIQDLKDKYDSIERPVLDHTQPLNVKLKLILQQLVDVDEKNQIITVVVWMQSTWNDYKMKWDPQEYGNISQIQLPHNFLWKPDIILFNSADEHFDASFPVNFVVSSNGDVLMAPPGIVRVSCELSMTWFPFDEQVCYLKFGSWTYTGEKLDLRINEEGATPQHSMDLNYYTPNGEFELLATPAFRKVSEFNGFNYIELHWQMHIKRKTLYYGLNWIVPSILISLSNVLGFTMPPECGEKITLQITNLLSVTVFLGVVSDVTPPTSESIPIIAAFFSISMLILGCSIITTLVIINVHFRNPRTHEMGEWTRYIFLDLLPYLLLMSRPGRKFCRPLRQKDDRNSSSTASSRNRKTSSHLADEEEGTIGSNGSPHFPDEQLHRLHTFEVKSTSPLLPNLMPNPSVVYVANNSLDSGIRDIITLLNEFKTRIEEEEQEDDLQSDWRFMAMVIDRLSLFFYTFLLLGTVLLVVLSTPRLLSDGPQIEYS